MKQQSRRLHRGWIVSLAAVILCFCVPGRVNAATYSFQKNTQVTIPSEQSSTGTGQYIWISYKAPEDGYLTVTASAASVQKASADDSTEQAAEQSSTVLQQSTGEFRLYHSGRKTALSDSCSFNTQNAGKNSVSYGMKKKTTYYLRVKTSEAVVLSAAFHKAGGKSGSSKKKAVSVNSRKTVSGVIPAGDKTAHWYKVWVKKKQVLHFYYAGSASGKLRLTFSGTYLKTADRYIREGNASWHHTYTTERVQPGTYYIRVERGSRTSSGAYQLKWK